MVNFTSLKSWLLTTALFVAGVATAQTELLQNGGFEEWNDGGKPVHWVTASSVGNATLSQSADARTGSSSVMVAGASSNKRLGYEEMTLLPGTYTFTVYAKAATEEAASCRPGYAPIKEDGSADGSGYKYGDYVNDITNTEWVQASYEFTLAEETRLCLVVMNPKSPGKDVLLDDASLTTTDGGIVPDSEEPEPDPSTSVFSADFSTSLDGFTSVSASGSLEWYNDYQSAKVTGYQDFDNDGTKENQAGVTYLVSPAIDLSQVEAAYVSVNMAINYERGDINANNALLISKDYAGDANTATWTSLTYDESGLNSDFTFRSKEINIPAEFVGGSVVIAFRHTCEETFSSTWEVKSLDVISGTAEEPTEPDVPENESSRENPYSVAEAMAKYDASVAQPGVWVEGYIVGYATGSNLSSGAIFGTQAPEGGEVSATNLLIADNVDETNYENCIPVQLPAGDVRDALNLQSHPENLGKPVVLMGSLEKYFGVAGLKSVTEYVLDGEAPEPEPTSVFAKATEIVSGKRYIIVAQDDEVSHVAQNISKTSGSGYLYVTDATATNDEITTAENNAFTITEGDGGYLIQDSYGRYLYQTGTFDGFNVSAELPESGYLWTIMFDAAGQATITNVDMNKWVQYSSKYNSFGSYETAQEGGILPYLYVETDGQSIESVGADNADAPVEVYTLGGVKVGDSLNGLQKGIYIVKQGNKVQKVLK